MNEELKFFGKIHKKNRGGVMSGGREGVGLVGGKGGCERNVGGRGVMWGMGDVNKEQKVLYNVQKGIVQY